MGAAEESFGFSPFIFYGATEAQVAANLEAGSGTKLDSLRRDLLHPYFARDCDRSCRQSSYEGSCYHYGGNNRLHSVISGFVEKAKRVEQIRIGHNFRCWHSMED